METQKTTTSRTRKVLSVVNDYLIITLGLLCYTAGWCIFVIPNGMVGGGVSGIGAIVQYATNGAIPVSYTFFFVNLILLIIGIKVLGKAFGVKTVYAVVVTSLLFRILPDVIPQTFIDELAVANGKLLCALIGGAMSGLGIGLGFTIALTLLGAIREFLGTGKIFNLALIPEDYGMLTFVLAPGAFIALGYLIAIVNRLRKA